MNEDYIRSCFDVEEPRHDAKFIAIYSNNREKVEQVFEKLSDSFIKFVKCKDDIHAVNKDGVMYKWAKPIYYSRAYKYSEVYIDLDILNQEDGEEIMFNVILPSGIYCKRDNVHFI